MRNNLTPYLASYIRILKNNKYPLIIFLLISTLPFFWFRESVLICSWDTGYGFFCPQIGNDLSVVKYVWDYSVSAGRPMAYYHATFFTTSLLYDFLEKISFNPAFGQALLFSSIILISLISMYLLVLELFKNNKERKHIAFFSSIFYILNFGTLFWFFYNTVYFIYIVPATPLILYLVLMSFKGYDFVYVFLISLSLSIFSIIFFNIAFGVLILVICLLFYLSFNGIRKLRYLFLTVFLFLLLNSFWILPAINSYQYFITDASKVSPIKETFETGSKNNLLSTLILIPQKDFWFINISATSWIDIYYSGLFRSLSIILIILIFSALLNKDKVRADKKVILLSSALSLIGIFLAKGKNEPLGFLMDSFMNGEITPFLPRIFAMSNQKFSVIIILFYSILFGYGSTYLLKSIRKYNKKIFLITRFLIILSLIILSTPFIDGRLINSHITFGGMNISSSVEIPEDYKNLDDYLMNNSRDYRALSLPLFPYNMGTYNWTYGYLGEPFEKNLFHRAVFSIELYRRSWDNGIDLIINSIDNSKNNSKDLDKISGILNIEYIMLHHDVDVNNGNYVNQKLDDPEHLKNILIKNKLEYILSFGKIDLYKVPDNYFLPHIYTTNKYTITGNLNSMSDLVGKDSFIPGDSIIFVEDDLKKEEINRLKEKEDFNRYNKFLRMFLNDSYFETSAPIVGDCCNGNPGIAKVYATLSNDSSEGEKSLNLTSENHCACVAQNIPDFDKNSIYKMDFDYKHISGTNPKLCVWVTGCNKCSIDSYIDNSTEWKTHSEYLSFENCTTDASLYFYSNQPSIKEQNALYLYSNSDGNETTTNLYDNIRIEKLTSIKNETNPLNDSSFESGSWQKEVGDCCNGNSGSPLIYASRSTDAIDGRYSLNLTSGNHCACVAQTVSLDRTSCYNITFDYKHVSGDAPKFCLWKPESSKCDPRIDLEKSYGWKTYSFTTCTQKIPEVTTNLYDNVRIEKVIISNESGYHPNISFKRINPTKYEVNIENATKPFFLVFSESYHPQWKAFLDKSFDCEQIAYYNNTNVKECKHEQSFTPSDISYLLAKPLPEDNHFTANGYANSWYIDPKDIGSESFTMTLYFLPQSYFYLGLIISGTTFIVCIAYLVYDWRKSKKPESQKYESRKPENGKHKNWRLKRGAWNHEWKPVSGEHAPFMDIASHKDIRQRIANKFQDSLDYVSDNVRDIARKLKDFIASQKLYHYR